MSIRPLARAFALALSVLALPALLPAAQANDAAQLALERVPACADRIVLADVTEKAGYRGQLPYQHPVDVTGYDRIVETRYVYPYGPGLRVRRWCQARAHLADGHTRQVYYLIESNAGFAGINFGVESCMAGRDLWNVHGGDCSTLRSW